MWHRVSAPSPAPLSPAAAVTATSAVAAAAVGARALMPMLTMPTKPRSASTVASTRVVTPPNLGVLSRSDAQGGITTATTAATGRGITHDQSMGQTAARRPRRRRAGLARSDAIAGAGVATTRVHRAAPATHRAPALAPVLAHGGVHAPVLVAAALKCLVSPIVLAAVQHQAVRRRVTATARATAAAGAPSQAPTLLATPPTMMMTMRVILMMNRQVLLQVAAAAVTAAVVVALGALEIRGRPVAARGTMRRKRRAMGRATRLQEAASDVAGVIVTVAAHDDAAAVVVWDLDHAVFATGMGRAAPRLVLNHRNSRSSRHRQAAWWLRRMCLVLQRRPCAPCWYRQCRCSRRNPLRLNLPQLQRSP